MMRLKRSTAEGAARHAKAWVRFPTLQGAWASGPSADYFAYTRVR